VTEELRTDKLSAESQNMRSETSLSSSYFSVRNFSVNRPIVKDFSVYAASEPRGGDPQRAAVLQGVMLLCGIIITGFAIGFALLYLIGLVRSLT
jgi:hypothetical protein